MATKKPARKKEAAHQPPPRVLGATNGEVTLGGQPYNFALHTVHGAREVRNYLTDVYPSQLMAEADSVGEQVVHGALAHDDWTHAEKLLRFFIHEDFPEGFLEGCAVPELIKAYNDAFNQDGFSWMTELLKNSAALTSRLMTLGIAKEMSAQLQRIEEQSIAEILMPGDAAGEPSGTDGTATSSTT